MKPPNPREYVSDPAKRAADIINGFIHFVPWDELKNKFLAIRLSDGGSDGTLYDSKLDAVRHQSDEKLCAYVAFRNCAAGTNAIEMERFLKWNRDAYDAGMRLPDPDHRTGGPEAFPTVQQYDSLRTRHLDHIFAHGAFDLSAFISQRQN
jgi:hypothetical protein